jgi:hypothetical protein
VRKKIVVLIYIRVKLSVGSTCRGESIIVGVEKKTFHISTSSLISLDR